MGYPFQIQKNEEVNIITFKDNQDYDIETGLYNCVGRCYNPKINRFMQPSEQLNAQTINGLNLCSYTNDFSSTFKTNTKENLVANNVFWNCQKVTHKSSFNYFKYYSRLGIKMSTKDTHGMYVYSKWELNVPETLGAVVCLYYA